jgi:thiaminase/transcriptional activator TenA
MSFSRSLKEKSRQVWEAGYNHPFVQELGMGTLDKEAFKFYLLQDYRYLLDYAKIFALGAAKAESEPIMARLTAAQYNILNCELNLHREYMRGFGITPDDIANAKQSLYNRAYAANMLAVAQTHGLAEIMATVFPCGWTYYDYACRLKDKYLAKLENNFFRSWIENYSSDSFAESFGWFYETLDELCDGKSSEELKRVEEIFARSVEFEYLFFDMAYKKEMGFEL